MKPLGAVAVAHLVLASASVVTTAGLAVRVRRLPPVPGGRAFVVLLSAFAWFAATHLVGFVTFDPGLRLVTERLQYVAVAVIPVAWLVFALAYTGNDDWFDRRALALLGAVPAATVALVWTNPAHGLVFAHSRVVTVAGLSVLDQGFGPWFGVLVAFTYGCLAVGSALLVRLVVRTDRLYTDQSAMLVVGILVPWAANVLVVTDTVSFGGATVDVTPYALAFTGVAFGHAVARYRLFDLVPATRRIGREAALASLPEGVVVVDEAARVVYVNDVAADAFDVDRDAVVGDPVRSVVGLAPAALDRGCPTALSVDDRVYEALVSPACDRRGRRIGRTVVLRDVTRRERRERRLRRQRDDLATLERVNAVVREVNRALVEATTPDRVREAVVEGLVDSGLYDAARIVETDVRTTAGLARHATNDADEAAADSATRACPLPGEGSPDRSRTVVPLTNGRTVYGVLVLYANREDAFDDRELAVLDELGATVGRAVHAARTRRLLVADDAVEVELECTDPAEPLVAAGRTGARLAMEGVVHLDDTLLVYCRVRDAAPGIVLDVLADHAAVAAAREVDAAPDDAWTLECRLTGTSLLGALFELGTDVRALGADRTGCRGRTHLDVDTGVRTVLDRVRETYPAASLVSKRTVDRRATDGSTDLLADLTDRQRHVVEEAYRAGYFEWPRDHTGEEVADRLDVSPPTLHKHLRAAERKLLDVLIDDRGRSPGGDRQHRPGRRR